MINKEKVMKVLSDNNLKIRDVCRYHEGDDLKKINNKNAQISKLLNRKPDHKGYYTDIGLAEDICKMVNNRFNKNYSPTYFFNINTNIIIIGDNIKGWVRPIDEQSVINFDCGHNFPKHEGILENTGYGREVIKVFKKRATIDRDGEFCESFCKSNNKFYCGILIPTSPDTYKLLDYRGGIIFENKPIEWSSKIVATFPYN